MAAIGDILHPNIEVPQLAEFEEGDLNGRDVQILHPANREMIPNPWHVTVAKAIVIGIKKIGHIGILIVTNSLGIAVTPLLFVLTPVMIFNPYLHTILQKIGPYLDYMIYIHAVLFCHFGLQLLAISLLRKFIPAEIPIDKNLNKENFLKPLLQNAIPELPAGTPNDHYKNLITLTQNLYQDDPQVHTILGIDAGSGSSKLYRWIYRMTNQTHFLMVPGDDLGKAQYYSRLTKLMNHLTLYLQRPDVSIECKKDFLIRLGDASSACGTRWMTEAETMYRQASGSTVYVSITDWVQGNNETFRRGLIENISREGSTHFLSSYLHNVNKLIKVPGGDEALNENAWGNPPSYFQSEFFLLYTSSTIAEHFKELINGTLIQRKLPNGRVELIRKNVQVDKERLIDWFKANVPENFMKGIAGREYMFLSQVMHDEDGPNYKAGDFKESAIQYLLCKCGILLNENLSTTLVVEEEIPTVPVVEERPIVELRQLTLPIDKSKGF